MSETIHRLIEHYGVLAVFIGSLAEGETAAILGGFFSHQRIFALWQAGLAAFAGAFLGDTFAFFLGRHFSQSPRVERLRHHAAFDRAFHMVRRHPALFVLGNRYAYGMRAVGGIAAGLSGIGVPRFLALNALSAAIWAALFCGLGFAFGLGAEQIVGQKLMRHERQLLALAIGLASLALAWLIGRHIRRSGRQG